MSEIFKKLDTNFNHILIHTGQHYDRMLSDVFFEELEIRKPDFNLRTGKEGLKHYEQLGKVTVLLIDLLQRESIHPDIVLFLGDSNSVLASVALRKEGYRIGHIEAGMRSYDKRMLEETNRIVCDHCSDLLFVYHTTYAGNCLKEALPKKDIFVVGNTIVEPCEKIKRKTILQEKSKNYILLDIHRPENFRYPERMNNIFTFVEKCYKTYNIPVKMVRFERTFSELQLKEENLESYGIKVIPLVSYVKYLELQYNSLFMISDSGTAQEEPALLNTPVIVPRDFTERPLSMTYNCSYMINANRENSSWDSALKFVDEITDKRQSIDPSWLGDGTTSDRIVDILQKEL